MNNNDNLSNARKIKNDEFYTKAHGHREGVDALQRYVCRKDHLL